jgi:hypothetical protein
MAKNAVTDWDATTANNTDIAGINIAEGCPAAGVNDALRTFMGQIAVDRASVSGPLLKSGGAVTGAITGMPATSTVLDGAGGARFIGFRGMPFTSATAGRTLALTDAGMTIPTTGTINIPLNAAVAFPIGDAVAVYNNSASSISITITATGTLRLGGSTTTGTRTLAAYGFVVLYKVGTDEWVALNGGVA